MNKNNYIVAVEIGSSKIKGAIGQVDLSGILTVKGIEEEHQSPNHVRHGCVQNVKEVANELHRVITKLNNYISPAKISAVYLGVGGRSLKSAPAEVKMQYADDTEVTREMVDALLNRAIVVDPMAERLCVEPVEFRVNGKAHDSAPVGMLAHELGATANVVSCRSQLLKNLKNSVCEKLSLSINDYVVRPLALGDLVLTSDERRSGSMLVDCGAETTTVAIYKGGAMRYLATIPLGSRHITRDLMTINPLEERAEEIKKSVGDAHPDETRRPQQPEEIDNSKINKIVAARASEIIANIAAQLGYAGLSATELPGGIVIVGGGSMLKGFAEALALTTGMGVRRGSLPPTVKLVGNKISTGEDLDVISLLNFVAGKPNIRPCTVAPEPAAEPISETPAKQAAPAEQPEPDDEEDDMEGINAQPSGFFSKVGGFFSKLSSPKIDDFDDEES